MPVTEIELTVVGHGGAWQTGWQDATETAPYVVVLCCVCGWCYARRIDRGAFARLRNTQAVDDALLALKGACLEAWKTHLCEVALPTDDKNTIPCRCGVVRDISNAAEMEEFAMSLHTAEMCLWGG